jgi:hypothetical protein
LPAGASIHPRIRASLKYCRRIPLVGCSASYAVRTRSAAVCNPSSRERCECEQRVQARPHVGLRHRLERVERAHIFARLSLRIALAARPNPAAQHVAASAVPRIRGGDQSRCESFEGLPFAIGPVHVRFLKKRSVVQLARRLRGRQRAIEKLVHGRGIAVRGAQPYIALDALGAVHGAKICKAFYDLHGTAVAQIDAAEREGGLIGARRGRDDFTAAFVIRG